MVIDGVNQNVELSRGQIICLGDRHTGVGFDQLLLLQPAHDQNVDFTYRIFNADGSEVGQCGNGARCAARFVVEQGLSEQKQLRFQTQKGFIDAEIIKLDWIKVSLGVPEIIAKKTELTVLNQQVTIGAVSVGNPHAVLFVDDVNKVDIATLGAAIEQHTYFPDGANVSLVQIVDQQNIIQRVWERGAGITQACGSAACAAAIIGQLTDRLATKVTSQFTGGELQIDWQGVGKPVYLTGPAAMVYLGSMAY